MKAGSNKFVYQRLIKKTACFAACLALLGMGTVYQSMTHNDSASADALYETSEANPSFTVQHVGDMTQIDIQPGEGAITVLTDDGESYHASLKEDGTVKTVTNRMELYEEYVTSFVETNSIAEASFLNGEGNVQADGYILREIWFGQDKTSDNQSDFLTLAVPEKEGRADLSYITLTNNPDNPELSEAAGGYYMLNENGEYVICIQDGDVIRLVFEMESDFDYANINAFDYDASDGGYYLSDDYFRKGDQHATSGQAEEEDILYVDAVESGIHSAGNYSGEGAKLAFGGDDIGTDLANESLTGELNTPNVWNYDQQEETFKTGVTKGLATGIAEDGSIQWSDLISSPNLFSGEAEGRTDYSNLEYSFTFKKKGFSRTLSAVESKYGTGAEKLENLTKINGNLTNSFWFLDVAPSYGTDGHDPVWGSSSGKTYYYRSNDRAPEVFEASDDLQDHNSFFGFSYTQDFVLSPGYTGAFDFFGYSDDDMWVFAAQVDENGSVMTDTVVQAADLGGVHDGAAYYCDLWSVIDKVPYGEEAQNWRLFVFWLERDGSSASCYMNFTLPEEAVPDSHETSGIMIEAANYQYSSGIPRTFILDDGTHNRYQCDYDDGSSISIVSGEEFTILSGSYVNISGLISGIAFTVKETGRSNVWLSTGSGYTEGNEFTGTVGENKRVHFVSTAESGTLTIAVEGNGTPEGGYKFRLTLDNPEITEIAVMDKYNNPIGSRFTDENGQIMINMAAGETFVLYGLPDGTGFTLDPLAVPGWHISELLLDNAEASGYTAVGELPAYVVYRYVEKEIQAPSITMEQSITGDWSTDDILLGTGALLSYKITVTNPNDTNLDVVVTDTIPEGLDVMTSSMLEGYTLTDGTLGWELTLEPNSVTELSFTCQVTVEETSEITNSAWVMENDEAVSGSNSVTVHIP